MTPIPRKALALFGEFIHEFNQAHFQLKGLVIQLMENQSIGRLFVISESFDFILKRVNAIYGHLIEDKNLTDNWKKLQQSLKESQKVRNDIAHAHCDVNPKDNRQFVLIRFSENNALKFSTSPSYYEFDDLKTKIRDLKKTNRDLKKLIRKTLQQELDLIPV